MVEDQQPDGVIVCVAPAFHATVAIELMELGCHVYTEKPPAETASRTRAVRDTKRRTGRICMTGFKKRFAPAYVKTKAIIGSDTFGEPAVLSILRTWDNFALQDDPRSEYLLDSGIHAIDLASFLFGQVVSVSAMLRPVATYAVALHFSNNAVGTLTLTDRMSTLRPWEQITVIGSNAVCIQVDNSVEMIAFQRNIPFVVKRAECRNNNVRAQTCIDNHRAKHWARYSCCESLYIPNVSYRFTCLAVLALLALAQPSRQV